MTKLTKRSMKTIYILYAITACSALIAGGATFFLLKDRLPLWMDSITFILMVVTTFDVFFPQTAVAGHLLTGSNSFHLYIKSLIGDWFTFLFFWSGKTVLSLCKLLGWNIIASNSFISISEWLFVTKQFCTGHLNLEKGSLPNPNAKSSLWKYFVNSNIFFEAT